MDKKTNPFAIKKSPVEIISAQSVTLDDYVKRGEFGDDEFTNHRACPTGFF